MGGRVPHGREPFLSSRTGASPLAKIRRQNQTIPLPMHRPPAWSLTSSKFTAWGCYARLHPPGYKSSVRRRAHAQPDRFERLEPLGSVDCVNSHARGGAPRIAVPFHGHALPCSSALLPKKIVERRTARSAPSRPVL